MKYLSLKTLLSALLLSVLTGCSALQPKIVPQFTPSDWPAYQQWMQAQQQWQLTGKAGVRTPGESNSAGFSWQQARQHSEIALFGPFSSAAARIIATPQQVTLETDGQRYQATSPEALLEQQLGWQLPIRQLVWWVRGIPAPDSDYQQTLANNRLQTLSQNGWHIRYSRYSDTQQLPEKLTLTRDNLRIVLVIHEWTIAGTSTQ